MRNLKDSALGCLLASLCIALASLVSLSALAEAQNGIHVTGRAVVPVEPDIVRMTLQVSAQEESAVAVKRQIDEVTRKVLKLTDNYKIARRDVTAAVVNLSPIYKSGYSSGRRTVDGMQGSRTINVTLRKLDNYGDFMNEALASGINNISGVALDTSKRAELEDQALNLAIADARARALQVAQQFDVALGAVKNVQVQPSYAQPVLRQARLASSSGEDFSGGEIDIRRDVQATFAIVEAENQANL